LTGCKNRETGVMLQLIEETIVDKLIKLR